MGEQFRTSLIRQTSIKFMHKKTAVPSEVFLKRLSKVNRGKQPIIWRRITRCSIKFVECLPQYYYHTLELIKNFYFNEDALWKNRTLYEDNESKEWFLKYVCNILSFDNSIIAIDQSDNDAIIGLILMQVVEKLDYGRSFISECWIKGDYYRKILKLTNHLSRLIDLYNHFSCNCFLRVHFICIHPRYRHLGLGKIFGSLCYEHARALTIPVVMGIFNGFSMQKIFRQAGMQDLKEVKYAEWRDEYNEIVFKNVDFEDKSCILMAGEVPTPMIATPAPPPSSIGRKKKKKNAKKPVKKKRPKNKKIKKNKKNKKNKKK